MAIWNYGVYQSLEKNVNLPHQSESVYWTWKLFYALRRCYFLIKQTWFDIISFVSGFGVTIQSRFIFRFQSSVSVNVGWDFAVSKQLVDRKQRLNGYDSCGLISESQILYQAITIKEQVTHVTRTAKVLLMSCTSGYRRHTTTSNIKLPPFDTLFRLEEALSSTATNNET